MIDLVVVLIAIVGILGSRKASQIAIALIGLIIVARLVVNGL